MNPESLRPRKLTPRETAVDQQMHQLLAEVGGIEQPPDLSARILMAAKSTDRYAPPRNSGLVAAAVLMLGVGVALGVAMASGAGKPSVTNSSHASSHTTQDSVNGGPLVAIRVRNAGELADVPETVEAMTCFGLTDADLASMRRFPRLRMLRLGGTPMPGGLKNSVFTSKGLAHLQNLALLERLDLSETARLDTAAVSQLALLPRLKWLSIAGAKLHTGSIAELAKIAKLEALDVSYCKNVNGEDLWKIAELPELRELNLTGVTSLASKDLASLQRGRNLRVLQLSGIAGLSDESILAIAPLRELRTLHIAHCPGLTDKALKALQSMPFLRDLDLSNNPNFTDAAVELLPKGLERLQCSRCPELTDAFLTGVSNLPILRTFSVHWAPRFFISRDHLQKPCQFTATGIGKMLRASALTNIDLSLHGNFETEPGWPTLWKEILRHQHIRTLALRGFSSIDDDACRALAKMPRLEWLDISGTSVTDRGLALLAVADNRWKGLHFDAPMNISLAGIKQLASQPLEELSLYRLKFSSTDARQLIAKLWPRMRDFTLPDGSEI